MDCLYKRPGHCAAFTLIEVVSVVAVIFILAGVITIRLGDLRSAALTTSAHALEKEFAKAVESLLSHGADLRPLQNLAARNSVVSQRTSDPEFMSLQTTNYRLSESAAVNLQQVADIVNQLNSMLLASGFGIVKGQISQEMLRVFNTDLVVVRDSGNSIRGMYLRFSKP